MWKDPQVCVAPSGSSPEKKETWWKENTLLFPWLAFPLIIHLTFPIAASTRAFTDIKTRVSRLPLLTKDKIRALQGPSSFSRSDGAAEAPSLIDCTVSRLLAFLAGENYCSYFNKSWLKGFFIHISRLSILFF